MGKKDRNKLLYLNSRGFTLVGVLMVLIVLSVLGLGITAVASNSLKVSTGERDDQSVYYIAEAGLTEVRAKINALVKEAFVKVDEEYRNVVNPIDKEAYLIEKSFEERFLETAENKIGKYISENQPSIVKKYERHFDIDDEPTATITVIQSEGKENSYIIKSVGNIEGKSRTISQVVEVSFGHELTTEEVSIDGSGSSEGGTFRACANAYLNSATTSGSAKFEGDIILREDSTLNMGGSGGVGGNIYSYGNLSITNSAPIAGGIYSNGFVKLLNAMTVGNNVHALGEITFNNSSIVNGNVFSNSNINISSAPIINGQLYASGPVTITNGPKVSGDIVSESNITITNWGTTANKVIANGSITRPDPNLIIEPNKSINQLPKPLIRFNGLGEVSELYKDSDCTDLDDEKFKQKMPIVTFQTNSNSLPGETELIEFTDSKTELHFNEFTYDKYDKVNIKLPMTNDDAVYSLYFNSLNMKNRDIHISGNGKVKIYIKDTLSLGKVIQEKDSSGKKRSNFDTTIYYLNDNKKELTLSNWGSCKIEANIYVKNASLKTNGCMINGNIVVLGNDNKVTLAGNNTTNGQIFYLPESDLIATGLVNVSGYVVARNMSGSGNVTISNPTSGEGSIDTDIFEKPSSPTIIQIKNYIAKTLLLTEQQKEK